MRHAHLSKLLRIAALLACTSLLLAGIAGTGGAAAQAGDAFGQRQPPPPTPAGPGTSSPGPKTVQATPGKTSFASGISAPFRDLPQLSSTAGLPTSPAQAGPVSANIPSSISFDGLSRTGVGGGTPPDTVGDVGPTYYVQAVDNAIGIFNKATGVLQSSSTFDSLFGASAPDGCKSGQHHGDPNVIYDRFHDRWIVADIGWVDGADGPYYVCTALSTTNDPTGTWYLIPFVASIDTDTTELLPSSPRIGLWPNGLLLTALMLDCTDSTCSTFTAVTVRVFVIDLNYIISDHGMRPQSVDLATSYEGIVPVNLLGGAAPGGPPAYFVALDGSGTAVDVWQYTFTFFPFVSGSFTGPTQVSATAYSAPPAIPQSGTAQTLDPVGGRLMPPAQYRYVDGVESIWLSHTVSNGGVAGLRWYQLDVTGETIAGTPVQSGTYQPDSTYRWLPSLAVDGAGDMAIGYSASSSSINPAIRAAGRLVTDPAGTLGQAESTLQAGSGSQTGSNVWGLHSSMAVDSTDDCTFWYSNEYYASTGSNWSTAISHFRFGAGQHAPTDFEDDGKTDPAKYIAAGAIWSLRSCSGKWVGNYIGSDGAYVVNSDFDGDGKTDPAKYIPPGAVWWLQSSDGQWGSQYIGNDGTYVPASDFDGDGKTDPAKILGNGALWYMRSGSSYAWASFFVGTDGTYIAGSDFDGDGKTDPAKLVGGSVWYFGSQDSAWHELVIGTGGTYVPRSDYDGDGKTDPARFAGDTLYYLPSTGGGIVSKVMGSDGTIVPGVDFDGDGKTDPAKYVSSVGSIWYMQSGSGDAWASEYIGTDPYQLVN